LQIYRNGKILKRSRKDKNEVTDCGDYYEVCLYHKKNKELKRTKVDKDDLDKIKDYKWWLSDSNNYVCTSINKKKKYIHSLILGVKKNFIIDHINHDPLDNRNNNLRFVTAQQNSMNNKGRGYSWDEINKKWRVDITVGGKRINLGRYKKKSEAIDVSRREKQKYFGGYAYNYN
jgi:hypothetical protein